LPYSDRVCPLSENWICRHLADSEADAVPDRRDEWQ